MNRFGTSCRPLLLAVTLLALAATGRADTITAVFLSPVQTGAPGDPLTFGGTITNNAGTDLYINGAGITVAGFGEDDTDLSPFILNVTGLLADGASIGPFDFFTLAIPGSFAPGLYGGTMVVQGGATGDDDAVLGVAQFEVDVQDGGGSQIPEPASLALSSSALGGLLVLLRCRKSRS